MNKTFSTILDKHESDDKALLNTELFIKTVLQDYANGEEIIKYAMQTSMTVEDFISKNYYDIPIVPIRQSNKFYIKKHTQIQIPYYHSHLFYELIYVHKGSCIQQLKDRQLNMTKGDCVLLSPGAAHLIKNCGKSDIILKAVIPKDIFDETGGAILGDIGEDSVIVFDKVNENAEFAILKLLEYQAHTSPHSHLIAKCYLTILFAELTSRHTEDIVAKQMLDDYFSQNIKTASLSQFASQCNYNVNYASRYIKDKTGKTFSQLLTLYRFERAKSLLSNTDMPIEEIANEIGYCNASGFYKSFFSLCGMTPSQYRNTLK